MVERLSDVLKEEQIRRFLAEDIGYGDITSLAVIPEDQQATATLYYKEPGVAAGLGVAAIVFSILGCNVTIHEREGNRVAAKKTLLTVEGSARALFAGERTALNLVGHMAGIASTTANIVEECRRVNPGIRVAATRKTLPGLREFEKQAVELGGGDPHRIRLDDCILIKDNHLELVPSITEAVRLARSKVSFTKKIEIETRSLEQAAEAAEAGAEIIMLDNMTPEQIKDTLDALEKRGLRKGHIFEASGRITPENAAEYAATGIDVISLGYLTHSVKALDVKLEIRIRKKKA
jgi:nicotinate-nucleotide pyrophosphorylase (carboxylating)